MKSGNWRSPPNLSEDFFFFLLLNHFVFLRSPHGKEEKGWCPFSPSIGAAPCAAPLKHPRPHRHSAAKSSARALFLCRARASFVPSAQPHPKFSDAHGTNTHGPSPPNPPSRRSTGTTASWSGLMARPTMTWETTSVAALRVLCMRPRTSSQLVSDMAATGRTRTWQLKY